MAGCTSRRRRARRQPTPEPERDGPTAASPRAGTGPAGGRLLPDQLDEAVGPPTPGHPGRLRERHTSQTYAVGELDLVVSGHLLAVDSERSAAGREAVPAPAPDYVGATPEQLRLSMLRPVWFTPTIEQSDARRRLVPLRRDRGDRGLEDRQDRQRHLQALAKPAGRDEYGMCGTAAAGQGDVQPRALPGGPQLEGDLGARPRRQGDQGVDQGIRGGPGRRLPRREGRPRRRRGRHLHRCRARPAADALDFEWGYEWPTKEQWRAGQTFGRCWAPA